MMIPAAHACGLQDHRFYDEGLQLTELKTAMAPAEVSPAANAEVLVRLGVMESISEGDIRGSPLQFSGALGVKGEPKKLGTG
jgi:hypothetical protein